MRFTTRHLFQLGIALLAIALFGVAGVLAFIGADVWRQQDAYAVREQLYMEELSSLKREFEADSAYLHKILNDEEFFENVVRERLGYSREGERVIIFDSGN